MPNPTALTDLCALLEMQNRGAYNTRDRQTLAVILARAETRKARRLHPSGCSEGPAGTAPWHLPR